VTHGGAFWGDIGYDIKRLGTVVRADVMDAWFPPCPGVMDLFHLAGADLIATSPPENSQPLLSALAVSRGLPEESLRAAGGSSEFIYHSLPYFAVDATRVVVLDPTYVEYLHVANSLLDLPVFAIPLDEDFDAAELVDSIISALLPGDLLILVNPNSPTGTFIPRSEMARLIDRLPEGVKLWMDETYMEYVGSHESCEALAAARPGVVVCKSMSKVYALSGLRVAYLVGHPDGMDELSRMIPPWSVSLPAMMAAIIALREVRHYKMYYEATESNRLDFADRLRGIGCRVWPSTINCLLTKPPDDAPKVSRILKKLVAEGIYLRDASAMGASAEGWLRITVRGQSDNARVLHALATLGFE
jgi:histidinol-phosphate/aromatic aminotransferase/cobyric acid decarboxylase-like protein